MDIPILKIFLSPAKFLKNTDRNPNEKQSSSGFINITISKCINTN